ncbi:MAG: hypothetical protein PHW92_10375 [Lutibacter sp.]|nr:hypothetical protein [Lutibacter sp.]
MKICKSFIFVLLAFFVFFNSCNIQKRKYMSGYHVNRIGRFPEKRIENIVMYENNLLQHYSVKKENLEFEDSKSISSNEQKEDLRLTKDETVVVTTTSSAISINYDNSNIVNNKSKLDQTHREFNFNSYAFKAVKSKSKSELSEILVIIVLALFLFGTVKMLFTIGKKPYQEKTIDEIKQIRSTKGLPEESSIEDDEIARELLDKSVSNWVTYTKSNGEKYSLPEKNKHLKETKLILAQVQEMLPTNVAVLEKMNEIGYSANEMASRKFSGSVPLIIVSLASVVVLALLTGGAFFTALLGYWWVFASIVFYVFASRAPKYLIEKRLRFFDNKNISSTFIASMVSVFTSTPSTQTVEYTYYDGHKETREEFNFAKLLLFFLLAIVFMLMGMFIIFFGLINFFRNYLLYF